MLRAKFWHSSKLARKQAYINVAKASLLQAQVPASPDPAHFISLLHSIIPWRGHLFQKQEFMHGLGRWEPCVHCLWTVMIWSSGPTLSILIIIIWKHSPTLECSSVATPQPHETPYLGWAFSLRRMAKVVKCLRSDPWPLQDTGGSVLIIKGASKELSY